MSEYSRPTWWNDVQQSCNDALNNFESVLDVLERELAQPFMIEISAINNTLERWQALQHIASLASEQISRSLRLATSRRRDAERIGLTPPEDCELTRRTDQVSARSQKMCQKIRSTLEIIEQNHSFGKSRHPGAGRYHDKTPSYVDVRV